MESLLCVLVVVVLNVVVLVCCGRGRLCLWSTVLVAAVGCVGGRWRLGFGCRRVQVGGCEFVVVIPIVPVNCFCFCSLLLVSAGVHSVVLV